MDLSLPDQMGLDDFVELEKQVWHALATGDQGLDQSLLSDDFLGVYPTGFSDRSGHVGQLANGPTVAGFNLSEARLLVVTATEVMLSYRAEWQRPQNSAGELPDPEFMYISSLWSFRDGRWINIFSQDTPVNHS